MKYSNLYSVLPILFIRSVVLCSILDYSLDSIHPRGAADSQRQKRQEFLQDSVNPIDS